MKTSKTVDQLVEMLMKTEGDIPCGDFLQLPLEERKCAEMCSPDGPRMDCWLRWVKLKGIKKKRRKPGEKIK